jgi:tRNA G18 (ribose-2'-O)-methylase SpoU
MMTEVNEPSGGFNALDTEQLREAKLSRREFAGRERNPIRVVLDGVAQNYNIGAIFRLCDALLIERLVVCGVPVNLKKRRLVQAAQGTQNWVPWTECESAKIAVAEARSEGYQIVIAELTANSIAPDQFMARFPVCLVLGAEFSGVSTDVAALADAAIAIPMLGMANSINVSTAAAIILYQLVSKAKGTG